MFAAAVHAFVFACSGARAAVVLGEIVTKGVGSSPRPCVLGLLALCWGRGFVWGAFPLAGFGRRGSCFPVGCARALVGLGWRAVVLERVVFQVGEEDILLTYSAGREVGFGFGFRNLLRFRLGRFCVIGSSCVELV